MTPEAPAPFLAGCLEADPGTRPAGRRPSRHLALLLSLSLALPAAAHAASDPPGPPVFRVLHTANGQGEIAPCG